MRQPTLTATRFACLALLMATGCATVKMQRLRPDYATVDRQATRRLVVVTQPLPDGVAAVGDLFSKVARRYVNQKREYFIVKQERSMAEGFAPQSVCGEGLEGVLWLKPTVKKVGEGVEGTVDAQLVRCSDGQEVWAAQSAGSFPSDDKHLVEVAKQYVSDLGPTVAPYVAPAFNLLRPMLDTLPEPAPNEDIANEKIELGE